MNSTIIHELRDHPQVCAQNQSLSSATFEQVKSITFIANSILSNHQKT